MDYVIDGQITVGELIKELSKFDDNDLVWTEGCDCIGAACEVISDEGGVMIGRCN